VHRTVWWCTGQCPVPRLARRRSRRSQEKAKEPRLKIIGLSGMHWTVWCANGARGQRSAAQSAGDAWPAPTVGWSHRTVSGLHRIVSSAQTGPKVQRSAAPDKEGDRAPDNYCSCSVVHRTVRCATRQKARIVFQLDLQRLLAVLGL
jgi:hypothetical protein